MPDDFGFVFRYGTGFRFGQGIVDSNITADLRLSPQQLDGFYRRTVEIGIEECPRVFIDSKGGS